MPGFAGYLSCSYRMTSNKNFPGINNLPKTILKNILAFSKKVINLGADSYLCEQITVTELLLDFYFFSCS